LQALLTYAFEEMKLRRIEADVDPRNTASIKTLERLGFKREGLLRERWHVSGELQDAFFTACLNETGSDQQLKPRRGQQSQISKKIVKVVYLVFGAGSVQPRCSLCLRGVRLLRLFSPRRHREHGVAQRRSRKPTGYRGVVGTLLRASRSPRDIFCCKLNHSPSFLSRDVLGLN
jgi:hypothetical protein